MTRLLPRVLLLAALAGCSAREPPSTTWRSLVAPLAPGREVARGYVLSAPARGHERDVVFRATRASDGSAVEVHVVARGQWSGVRETRSFGVAWEEPRSRAPRDDAEAVTEALRAAIARNDHGLGPVDAIPLDAARPVTLRDRGLLALRLVGTRGPFPWWAVALSLAVAAAQRRREASRELVAVGVGALALRVGFGAWGPFHINQQGALWIDGALHPDALRAYGPGFAELYGLAARLVAPDTAVFALNAALGAVTAPLAMLVARRLRLSPGRALIAGMLVAADPVLLRVAATESYVTPVVALALAATWAFLTAADPAVSDRRRRIALVLAGSLFAAQCIRVHPLGWIAASLVPLLVGAGVGWRAALRCALVTGAVALATSGAVLADVLAAMAGRGVMAPTLRVSSVVAGVALGALAAIVPRTRSFAPTTIASLALGGLVWETYGQSDVWRLAAVHVVLAAPLFAAAAALPERHPRALGAALGAALLVAGMPMIRHRTTDASEYEWARRWLASRPPACRVVWVAFAGERRTVFLPTWMHRGASVALDARGPADVASRLTPLGCTWYFRGAACETADGAPACAAVERALVLTADAEVRVLAVASHRGLPYAGELVRVATYRVVGLRATSFPSTSPGLAVARPGLASMPVS